MESGGNVEAELLTLLEGGVDSPVAIAVGTSEGTRTPDARFTSAWYGHTDPGNGKRNQGSFSYQHSAESPKAADMQQLKKIKDVLLPKFRRILPKLSHRSATEIKLLFLVACDLYTQSEEACTANGGFLEQLAVNGDTYAPNLTNLIVWRVQSYIDPKTGKLDAPGFNNDPVKTREDQQRRTEAVLWAAETLGILEEDA